MASTTTNLGLMKPAYSDDADISDINGNMDLIDAEAGRVRANVAANYDSSETYAVGDYCLHDGSLYKCSTAISSPEAWTAGHWTQIKITGELSALNGDLTNKLEAEISLPSGYSVSGNNKVYKVGKVVQLSVALTIPAWTTKTLSINGLIPSGFTPGIETNFAGIDNTNDLAISCFISSGGNLSIYRSHTTSCISLRLGVTYLT